MKATKSKHEPKEDVSKLSKILVGMQFFFLVILFLTGPVVPDTVVSAIFVASGILLGQWAILTMRRSKLRLMPEVAKNASLVTVGPYAVVRHPMYTSVLLVGAGLTFIDFSSIRTVTLFLLLIVLISKAAFEESLLVKAFPGYSAYMKKTFRLIPFLY